VAHSANTSGATFLLLPYTPNANMADRWVGARDEAHASEASQALMFCFDNASPDKSCFVVDLVCFCFALPIRCCAPEYHQKELKSSTTEKVLFFFFRLRGRLSEKADEGK